MVIPATKIMGTSHVATIVKRSLNVASIFRRVALSAVIQYS